MLTLMAVVSPAAPGWPASCSSNRKSRPAPHMAVTQPMVSGGCPAEGLHVSLA